MRYFGDSLCVYLRQKIIELNENKPDIYVYDSDLLNPDGHGRFFSNHIPADGKSYVVIRQIGEIKARYNVITYNFAIDLDMKKTSNIPYREFYYNAKGLRDILIKTPQKFIDDFWVVRIIDYVGATPILTNNESWNCELNFGFEVDVSTIPGEDLILSEEAL
jgi:hypothetical protein